MLLADALVIIIITLILILLYTLCDITQKPKIYVVFLSVM